MYFYFTEPLFNDYSTEVMVVGGKLGNVRLTDSASALVKSHDTAFFSWPEELN